MLIEAIHTQKPIKRGFKIWPICDAKTGYLYLFQIISQNGFQIVSENILYTGKGDSIENEGLGYKVVLKLSNNLPMNTLVAFDNVFTRCNLLEQLYDKHIFVGTVRSNRKDFPKMMKKQRVKTTKASILGYDIPTYHRNKMARHKRSDIDYNSTLTIGHHVCKKNSKKWVKNRSSLPKSNCFLHNDEHGRGGPI
ncbi:unnamed protein product [Euphydryas editha]|nr:unnamed protein product [Euphydryas editha]